ncbi:MAG: hypothetical protein M0P01_15655 [Treponema sp.]|nr:hypothetical protein [Treponema sp.]
MNTLKKGLYYFQAVLISLICIFGISVFFHNSGFLSTLLARSLHLKIAPSFTGGETAGDFFDDAHDDNGSGILCYPSNSQFKEGSLDLLRYTVHKPVFGAQWQEHPEYWQLDLEYRSGPSDVRNILMYIDCDGDGNGSTGTLTEGAENCCFEKAHPWDFAVRISENEGKVYNADRQFICRTETSVTKDGKQIIVRIPLQNKQLQKIYTAQTTWHYVLTGGFSKWDRGGFLPVDKRRSGSRGSTTEPSQYNLLLPKIYDILDDSSDKNKNQRAQLSSWNKDELTKAVLHPVEVSMKTTFAKENPDTVIAEIKKQYAAEQNAQAAQSKRAYEQKRLQYEGTGGTQKTPEEKLKLAVLAFNCSETDAAEALLSDIVKQQPENAEALAYYGSCVAIRGGKSSVVQAVKLVNDAFVYLNKAAELAEGTPHEITILMNRASVCASVPDTVFGKALTGAEDFTRCAFLYKKTIDAEHPAQKEKLFLAYLYASAYDCYKTAGKETEAVLSLKEAEKTWN